MNSMAKLTANEVIAAGCAACTIAPIVSLQFMMYYCKYTAFSYVYNCLFYDKAQQLNGNIRTVWVENSSF
jgi:hypothetical protein